MNFVVDSIPRAWDFTSLKVEFMVGVNMIRQKVSVQGCVLESKDNPSASWWALHNFVNSIDAKNYFNLMCLLLGFVNIFSLVSFKSKTCGILLSFLGSVSSYVVRSWEYFPSRLSIDFHKSQDVKLEFFPLGDEFLIFKFQASSRPCSHPATFSMEIGVTVLRAPSLV